MLSGVREWLKSVMIVTILISTAEILMPAGNIKKIWSFTGGLILLTALAGPFINNNNNNNIKIAGDYNYNQEVTRRRTELETRNQKAIADKTAEACNLWIENRAREMGFDIQAETGFKIENGIPIPWEVILYADWENLLLNLNDIEHLEHLKNQIALELGIPEERQTRENK